ncbi:hypothetical protein [Neisseria sicca]|uniref:hypothetical protein n=1 Tax=Neisseria sicca TaxID=490 RepID=UPI001649B398|nr:hypothetical protein [Neisseria sicca]
MCVEKNGLYGYCHERAIGLTQFESCPEHRPNRLCGVYIFNEQIEPQQVFKELNL